MKKYDCKNWTMNDIAHAMKGRDSLDRTIVIPMFQRGKRWKADRREAFIDSLLKGYPVGTLLFADLGNNTYSVIDGLQRCSTICEYILNPTKLENLSTIDEEVLDSCRCALFPGNRNVAINKVINDEILKYISSKKTFNDIESLGIAMHLCDKIATDQEYPVLLKNLGSILASWYVEYKKEFESICQTEIPVIVYSGDNSHLNEIFNRINKKGLPLSDYEIFAATWHEEKYVINKQEIVEYVIKKYDCLALDKYSIQSYDSNELRRTKKLTIFEFLFGLGKHIINTYDFLNLDPSNRDDEISSIGFELVDVCLNNSKKICDLANDIRSRKVDINLLERRIEESIKFVRDVIAPIFDFRGNQRDKKQYLHPKFFALSLIAFTFREMYDFDNLNVKKDSWEAQKNDIAKNILHHYVFEIVQNIWHDGGVGKMYSSVKERTFAEEITENNWNTLLNNYFETSLMNRQLVKIKSPTNIDKLLLNCIYADIFTVKDNSSQSFFDIEHIATKEWMKKLMRETHMVNGISVSHIANLCYLPESINRKKKAKTIYEDTTLVDELTVIEDKYSFTHVTDLNFLYDVSELKDASMLDEKYTAYLKLRYSKQKEKILKFLGVI